MIIKIIQPLDYDDNNWIQRLKKEFSSIRIEHADTRDYDEDTLIAYLRDADALVLSNRPLSKKVLEACPSLRFVSVAFTGLDHIDLNTCAQKNITVKNAAGYATHAVAELAIALALNLYRHIPQGASIGRELFGKKVGIIGFGAIGQETARLFSAFGCAVSFFHRRPLERFAFAKQITLEELLATSDIISLHLPLTSETVNFLNQERIAQIRPSAILINVARGPIIDQHALIAALNQNKMAGAALDVFDREPPLPKDHPVFHAKNILITPHIGYRTAEAFARRSEIAFEALRGWLKNNSS